MLVEFKIPGVPLSYNQHMQVNYYQRQMYLTKDAREWKKRVKLSTPDFEIAPGALLSIYVEVHSDHWYTKEGKVRRIDLPNLDKLLIDAIANRLGFDDSIIFDSHFKKVVDNSEYTLVKLSTYVLQSV